MNLTTKLEENKRAIKETIPIDKSFDIIGRDFSIGNRDAFLVFIDGFAKDDIMLWIFEELQELGENYFTTDNITKLLKRQCYIRLWLE